MARILADENVPAPLVAALRGYAHDMVTAAEAGLRQVPDAVVLDRAAGDGRCVLTRDRRHIVRLHHRRPDHAGILVTTGSTDYHAAAFRIHAALTAVGPLTGKLLRVHRPA